MCLRGENDRRKRGGKGMEGWGGGGSIGKGEWEDEWDRWMDGKKKVGLRERRGELLQ